MEFDNVDLQNCTLNCEFLEFPDDQPATSSFQQNGDTRAVVDLVSDDEEGTGAEEKEDDMEVDQTQQDVGVGAMELYEIYLVDEQGTVRSSCSRNVNVSLRCIERDEKLKGVEEVCLDGMTKGVGATDARVKGKRKLHSWMTEEGDSSSSKGCSQSKKLNFSQELRSVGVREGGGASVEGRRKLPSSMRQGGDKYVGKDVRNCNFKDLLEVVSKILRDDKSSHHDKNNGDFFETAQRRGMKLSQPRWWPPEGFDEKTSVSGKKNSI